MSTAAATIEAPAVSVEQERWRPSAQGWAARLVVLAVIFGGLIWTMINVDQIWADRIAFAAIYAIIGLSLNIVLGYTGQVSLGHHAFVGLAAFIAAYWVTEKGGCLPEEGCTATPMGAFWTGVFMAIVSGLVSAGILGLIALRIKGLYLALITLTYGFVALNSLFEIPFLTRGGAGMPALRPAAFATDHRFAFLCVSMVAVCLFIDWRLLSSKAGRAILAVKESEAVAASYAVNVTMYKLMAFMLSGAFAGLAGALFAFRREIVVAVDFRFELALIWVLMVVVGGLGSRIGVVIGSAFFALFQALIVLIGPLNRFIEHTLERDPEEFVLVIGPLLAILTMIQFPGGIAEQISPITRWLGGQRFTMHPEGKRKKDHGALLAKIGLRKKHHDRPDEPEALPEPAESTEILAPASGVLADDADDADAGDTSDDDATDTAPVAVVGAEDSRRETS